MSCLQRNCGESRMKIECRLLQALRASERYMYTIFKKKKKKKLSVWILSFNSLVSLHLYSTLHLLKYIAFLFLTLISAYASLASFCAHRSQDWSWVDFFFPVQFPVKLRPCCAWQALRWDVPQVLEITMPCSESLRSLFFPLSYPAIVYVSGL